MNKIKKGLLFSLLFLPIIVDARKGNINSNTSIYVIIFLELFITPHNSLFFFSPLSKLLSEDNSKLLFWRLFAARAILIVIVDLLLPSYGYALFMIDFVMIFVGAFIIIPFVGKKKGIQVFVPKKKYRSSSENNTTETLTTCPKCGNELKANDKFCTNCGATILSVLQTPTSGKLMVYSEFDPIYHLPEDKLLENFINKEMEKANMQVSDLIPSDILKRKNIFNAILATLIFIYISMIFFHFPIYTYILGLIIIIVFSTITRKYDLMDYIKKEVKARPNEKISNIVMSIKNTLVNDNSKKLRIVSIIVALIAPLIVFYKPVILYESLDNGYAVRFYAFGLTEYKTATIPSSHKGRPVISLRGNSFSNMFFLETVTLPDTITEIRGEAFLNDYNLKSVNLPKNLEEIKGSSFENCTSLERIDIPDSVTRIGGHAFYNCSSLREVNITKNSELMEIGSSAFRECPRLTQITIPKDTSVNERAFKNSPTTIYYYHDGGGISTTTSKHEVIYMNDKKVIYLDNNKKISLEPVTFDFTTKTFSLLYSSEDVYNELVSIDKYSQTRYTTSDGIIIDYLDCDKYGYTLTVNITYFD